MHAEALEVKTDKASYYANEELKVAVKNNSASSLWILKSVDGCGKSFFYIKRKTIYGWENVDYDSIVCEMVTFELFELKPNEEKEESIYLYWGAFPKGTHTYRIAVPYWKEKPFEGKIHDFMKIKALIEKASFAYSDEFTIESFRIESQDVQTHNLGTTCKNYLCQSTEK